VESTTLRREECTPNTRVAVMSQLRSWSYDPQSKKIYWLNGMAGTGKTTIAYSLCALLHSTRQLAASFFCSRQLPACRDFKRIIPTISYQLALFSRPFRYALSRALEADPEVHTRKLSEQFEGLIVKPFLEVKDVMPADLVVVIDALDECEDGEGVDETLAILLSHASSLPIKFFVTSRPEARILERMRGPQGERVPFELRLHDLEASIVQEDIRIYLKINLEHLNLSTADLERLVKQSGVLFIYAATVVRYIKTFNSAKRLKQVLDTPSSYSNKDKAIDSLYAAILEGALDNPDLDELDKEEMMLVLHTIICAQEPLTVAAITSLLKMGSETSVRAGLSYLLSVLNISESNGLVTTLHASFPDYILNQQRSKRFHCDRERVNTLLAQACFDMIDITDPPFNICRLESSYLLDKDVHDLPERISDSISNELFYACRYWGSHLSLAGDRKELLSPLRHFLSVRLLLWMEVMNLEQCIHDGARLLAQVQRWCQVSNWCNVRSLFLTLHTEVNLSRRHRVSRSGRFAICLRVFGKSRLAKHPPYLYLRTAIFACTTACLQMLLPDVTGSSENDGDCNQYARVGAISGQVHPQPGSMHGLLACQYAHCHRLFRPRYMALGCTKRANDQ
jgi:hypothetical protein